MTRVHLDMPMNRVEGDLELSVEIEDGAVVEARSSGTLFRGFERILVGRGALDGLVITPRICGLCSTSHLTAAALALDAIAGVAPPSHAVRVRNVALMAEHLQNDMRQAFLMFCTDFTRPVYAHLPLHAEAVRRYKPLAGSTAIEVLRETRKPIGIIAVFGGQWPHSSYMVPGGITALPGGADLLSARSLLAQYRGWYERRILGCSIERWQAVQSLADLDAWLDERPEHRDSEVGFFVQFCRQAGVDKLGKGGSTYVSYGSLPVPSDSAVVGPGDGKFLIAPGFIDASGMHTFDQAVVTEHIGSSWFVGYQGGRHPLQGITDPHASGYQNGKYSWCKAPRYDGRPAETGPLGELLMAGNPLFTDWVRQQGATAMVRELARIVRGATMLPAMTTWLSELGQPGTFYETVPRLTEGEGIGLLHGARGALGHWVRITKGRISHYQVVTPTGWNASPRDDYGVCGPIEQALVGTPVPDPDDPVAIGHVLRSFDPCLVCTVHMLRNGERVASGQHRAGWGGP